MANRGNVLAWVLLVVVAVCLQTAFLFLDNKQSATKTATDFAKAYFLLDNDLETYLCGDLAGDEEETPAAAYLRAKATEAQDRGFGKGMVRKIITHMEAETLAQDDESATIHLSGQSRTCIHPIFTYVASIFHIGKKYTFDETLELIKEDGQWKVCGAPFNLPLNG